MLPAHNSLSEQEMPVPEIETSAEPLEDKEGWHLRDMASDLHVIHPGFDERLGFGDRKASLTTEQIVEFIYSKMPRGLFVIGSHSFVDFSEMNGGKQYIGEQGDLDYQGFLMAQKAELERAQTAMMAKYPRSDYPTILFGIEADMGIDRFYPPTEVLTDPEIGLKIVTASFHYERIPKEKQTGEYFYQGFKTAIESGAINRLGHPLWELHRVYEWDPEKFQEIADLAKEKGIAFEITSQRLHQLYEEPTRRILETLIANGNLIDFGTDFHNFLEWMKRSAMVPESTKSRVTAEGEMLMQRWEALQTFPDEFKQAERHFWKQTLRQTLELDLPERSITQSEVNDYCWRLYKGELSEFTKANTNQEKEEVFVHLRDQFVDRVLPPATVEFSKDGTALRERLALELTELYTFWQKKPQELSAEEKQNLEEQFAAFGLNLGDLKRTLKVIYLLKSRFKIPKSQLVNVWPVAEQLQHLVN